MTAVLGACSRPAPAPEPVRAVRTVVLGEETAGGVREYAAEIRARVESRLGFRVGGKLIRRSVDVGQHVKAGQTLAQIDGTDLRLGQTAAMAGARAAYTNLELAQADFDRYQTLRDQGFIGAAELERRETALKSLKAQFDQARAEAGMQGNQAGYAVLSAPAAGVVTAIDAEVGAVLAAGTPVVQLAHDGPRDAVFSVPEDQVAVMRGLLDKAGALQVRTWAAKQTLPATVREVAAAADPTTRTFQVKADLGDASLLLGQTASVLMALPRTGGIVKLPLSAVMQQQGRTAVWLVDRATMTVKVQPIVIGGAEGNSVVVASGLSPGQTVVTAGAHVLSPGQKVSFYAEPASAAAR
ncbi:MAG: efflux RND transporter periplasmic adaptor subunit [Pseudomonadota bacterium]|nr:efflux RND transporter periplasmic adaptor subunit [Pseudomonadota bacterium]